MSVKFALFLLISVVYLASALPHGTSETGDIARGAAATFQPASDQEPSGWLASWFGQSFHSLPYHVCAPFQPPHGFFS